VTDRLTQAPPARAVTAPWPALQAARAHDPAARVPLQVSDGGATPRHAGSVARAHLAALRRWPQWLHLDDTVVTLHAADAARADALATMNHALRAEGLIHAWRDELFALFDLQGRALGVSMERAATRFWGTLTLGAHCNGFVADARGRPAQIWIARRSATKPTDPNRLDNLIGGGVPAGQSPRDTVIREGWEEAGLAPAQMQGLQRGRIVHLLRDIPEGLQCEWIHIYDLALPADAVPRNQDGEVAALALHDVASALALAGSSEMTVDASLVTLDFGLRRGLFDAATHATLSAAAAGLFAGDAA
jgi:8-oxo-dGTP pyrophosphatase MutT (NUDIX family)